jgi:hypothetical protein
VSESIKFFKSIKFVKKGADLISLYDLMDFINFINFLCAAFSRIRLAPVSFLPVSARDGASFAL